MVYKVLHIHFLTSLWLTPLWRQEPPAVCWTHLAGSGIQGLWTDQSFSLEYYFPDIHRAHSIQLLQIFALVWVLEWLSLVLPFQIVTHSSTPSSHQPSSFFQGYLSLSNHRVYFLLLASAPWGLSSMKESIFFFVLSSALFSPRIVSSTQQVFKKYLLNKWRSEGMDIT